MTATVAPALVCKPKEDTDMRQQPRSTVTGPHPTSVPDAGRNHFRHQRMAPAREGRPVFFAEAATARNENARGIFRGRERAGRGAGQGQYLNVNPKFTPVSQKLVSLNSTRVPGTAPRFP